MDQPTTELIAAELKAATEPTPPAEFQTGTQPETTNAPDSQAAKAEATDKKMGVVASKAKISANLNRKKALVFVQRQLDGKPTCLPAKAKTITAVVAVAKDGSITKVTTTPKNAAAAKCLKTKLAGKPAALKSKTTSKLTLQIKNL
ncbi:MAG: hypothetical protein HC883_05525 [Bdellovibrionaceae bacterium]|nr:hypothetical protein [Pseudobdellovibrionaceae bacterium]